MRWDEEHTEFILGLAHAGVSRSKIAKAFEEKFGLSCTKDMIVGRLTRTPAYVKVASPIRRRKPGEDVQAPPAPKLRVPAPRPCTAAVPKREKVLPSSPPRRIPPAPPKRPEPCFAFLGAAPRVCQWPIGEPKKPGFRFCGKPIARRGTVYCNDCHKRAYLSEALQAAGRAQFPADGD